MQSALPAPSRAPKPGIRMKPQAQNEMRRVGFCTLLLNLATQRP